MLRNSGSIIIITRRKKERFKQLPQCLIGEDIHENIGPTTYLHLFMLQMLCQIILKMFLGPNYIQTSIYTNNAFQPNIEGQSFNQTQSQGCGQRSNSREKVVKFPPIPMTYTELLPDLLKNALVPYVQQGLHNHHIPDIMKSMQSVNIMIERLAIQLKIVKHSNIKCNLCSTRGGLLFKSRRRVWKRIPRRVMQMLRLVPMLIKWRQSSRSMEMKLSILCTLVFPMNRLAIGNL